MTDYSDIAGLQEQMAKMIERLIELSPRVGEAKQVVDYDSDRRKKVLSLSMARHLAAGSSIAASETLARIDDNYAKGMAGLGGELKSAYQVIAEWDALRIRIEVVRSLLSLERTKVGMM